MPCSSSRTTPEPFRYAKLVWAFWSQHDTHVTLPPICV